MIDWKPIDTAPRDGSLVLLCGGKTGEWFLGDDRIHEVFALRPVTGFWLNGECEGDLEEWITFYWDSGWRGVYRNPTHWASLELPDGRIYE